MDESRKQFHEYMLERPGTVGDDISRRLKDGEYVHIATQLRWEAWQASRSAIEIELPPAVDGSNVPFAGNAWNAYRVEAVEAIRAAGIKVKE
ncbi:hypothetical protein [Enterobacter hormaechei]|uniref:hypothetical protein n=1 Tax=Enterobacter hormaechei TaxID=158836 RepID=UPI003315A8F8